MTHSSARPAVLALALAACGHVRHEAPRSPLEATASAAGPPAREPCTIEHTRSDRPGVDRTTHHFDDRGHLLVTERDIDGDGTLDLTIRRSYDAVGHLVAVDDGSGVVRYEVDSDGRVTARTNETTGQPTLRTAFEYDVAGHLVAERDAVSTTLYFYDSDGRQVRDELYAPGETLPRVTTSTRYDVAGRPLERETVDPVATWRETWTYDAAGRVVEHTSARKRVNVTTTTSYDDAGRRIGEVWRDETGAIVGRRRLVYADGGELLLDETTHPTDQSWERDRFGYCD